MKRRGLLAAVLMCMSIVLLGQPARIIGYWLTEEGQSQIEISQSDDGKFSGRIVWLEEPLDDDGLPKRDDDNPDRSLRSRPLAGLKILKGFSYDQEKGEWSGGTIYDPENGRTYSAYMRLDGNNTLRMRGYVMGMRFLGRSTYWERERNKRE